MSVQIADEDLLDDLRRVGEKCGHAPSCLEYSEYGDYSPGTIRYRYGSWVAGLAEAGYDVQKPRPPGNKAGRDELVTDLQRTGEQVSGPPTLRDQEEHGGYHPATFYNYFEDWAEALKAAGFGDIDLAARRGKTSQIGQDTIDELEAAREERDIRQTHLSDSMGRTTSYWGNVVYKGYLSKQGAEEVRDVLAYYDEHGYLPLPGETIDGVESGWEE